MKKILSLLLMLTVCTILSSSNAITAANSNQDSKKEKVKNILVSGIVTDEQGKRLKDVIVMRVRESESEPPVGVGTSGDGKYRIFINSDRTLEFSLAGYKSQKIDIKDRDEIDVVLKKNKK